MAIRESYDPRKASGCGAAKFTVEIQYRCRHIALKWLITVGNSTHPGAV